MAGKNYVTASVRVSEKEFSELTLITNRENISISAILRLCIQGLINGDVTIEKGELKTHVDTHGYAVSEISEEEFQENLRYKELKLDRLIAAFEKRGYPDEAIGRSVETMIQTVLDSPKYNPRRSRYDEGC